MPHTLSLLRRPEVERRIGRSRASVYADIAAGVLPRPVKISTEEELALRSEIGVQGNGSGQLDWSHLGDDSRSSSTLRLVCCQRSRPDGQALSRRN